jgi:hypothetical protein
MVEILVDYRPAELKRRTLSAMVAYDLTKALMDELMATKRRMQEQLMEAGEAGSSAALGSPSGAWYPDSLSAD